MTAQLQKNLLELREALAEAQKAGVDFTKQTPKLGFLSYDQTKKVHARSAALGALERVRKTFALAKENELASPLVLAQLESGIELLSSSYTPELAAELAETAAEVQDPTSGPVLRARLPSEVHEVVLADLAEMEKAFHVGCYRSAVMLCGRVLEVVLHRAYYEATQQDLLEKSPGMGLGNLIARMAEKGIKLDPSLANQIHLVNQARVYSVHHKHEPFNPSKAQTHAIILYTLDVIEKMFPQ